MASDGGGWVTNNAKFIADVEAFKRLTKDKMLQVAKQSAQDVIRIAQTPVAQGGNLPVDTSFLRNSLVTSLDGQEVAQGADTTTLGIAQMELGDTIRFAWTAEYALARHYMVGTDKGGGLWRDNAAQQWTAVVRKNAAKVR